LSSADNCRDALQEVNRQSMFKPVTETTKIAASADSVPELIREAFRTAFSP